MGMKTLEDLLDAADALANGDSETPQRPDFIIPEELAEVSKKTCQWLEQKETPGKGIGWFARQNIPSGTKLLVSKPLAMVMLWQEDQEEDENEMDEESEDEDGQMEEDRKEEQLNSLLVVELLKALKMTPELWNNSVSKLYPRTKDEIQRLPVREYPNDSIAKQIETILNELPANLQTHNSEISKRLPLIVRYNVLSVETCPELLSHPNIPGGHTNLSGAALYDSGPSSFNHNSRPNVARWAIGDIMCFVANQDIAKGTEACISYIEHDVLCESLFRRNRLLKHIMGFEDHEDCRNFNEAPDQEEVDGPEGPVVDSELQNELMMEPNPFERLDAIDQLHQQAQGISAPTEGEDDEMGLDGDTTTEPKWFECDNQNLNILKAITLDGLGQSTKALKVWEECVSFAAAKLPPSDESLVVVLIQAALCAMHLGEKGKADEHARQALSAHDNLFGGGSARLRRRYKGDFGLNLRKRKPGEATESSVAAVLWP